MADGRGVVLQVFFLGTPFWPVFVIWVFDHMQLAYQLGLREKLLLFVLGEFPPL